MSKVEFMWHCADEGERKQLSCAAGPWTYRTDTGDETGKVVESAELPEGGGLFLVILVDYQVNGKKIFTYKVIDSNGLSKDSHYVYNLQYNLIAWAEIRR